MLLVVSDRPPLSSHGMLVMPASRGGAACGASRRHGRAALKGALPRLPGEPAPWAGRSGDMAMATRLALEDPQLLRLLALCEAKLVSCLCEAKPLSCLCEAKPLSCLCETKPLSCSGYLG